MNSTPYTLSIEPFDGATYQHGFHLGTIEPVARQVAADLFNPQKMRTVALIRDRKIIDVFDGDRWFSDIVAEEE